jgi:hypothetical protein
MFGKWFGRKSGKAAATSAPATQTPAAPVPEAGPAKATPMAVASTPWQDAPDFAVANFALADLINNLPVRLTMDGRLHAETLVAASGVIAGYAALQALLYDLQAGGETPQAAGLHVITTVGGREFYFGDRLNAMLVPQTNAVAEASEKLWPLAAGGAVAAGLAPDRLPPLDRMFAHVAGAIGGEREGATSLPDHQPLLGARDLLQVVWPLALSCFESELSGRVIAPRMAVSHRWWPAIAATVANKMIRDVAIVLAPRDALTLVMETAIYASKLSSSAFTPA